MKQPALNCGFKLEDIHVPDEVMVWWDMFLTGRADIEELTRLECDWETVAALISVYTNSPIWLGVYRDEDYHKAHLGYEYKSSMFKAVRAMSGFREYREYAYLQSKSGWGVLLMPSGAVYYGGAHGADSDIDSTDDIRVTLTTSKYPTLLGRNFNHEFSHLYNSRCRVVILSELSEIEKGVTGDRTNKR